MYTVQGVYHMEKKGTVSIKHTLLCPRFRTAQLKEQCLNWDNTHAVKLFQERVGGKQPFCIFILITLLENVRQPDKRPSFHFQS